MRIMMNSILSMAFALVTGFVLGAIFYGGLWWTVKKAVSSKRPALWFGGGALLRMSIAITGFYFISQGNWKRLILCLIGFVMAHFAIKWPSLDGERKRKLFGKGG
jgi:F1F0 ATPase subunit 2